MKSRSEGRMRWAAALLTLALACIAAVCGAGTVQAKDARSDYEASSLYSYNGHIYQFVYSELTWPDAKNYAKKLGGHLAAVTSESEQNFIAEKISLNSSEYGGNYWLGASDSEEEGEWKWVTGEKFKYSYWDYGEPNNCNGAQDYLQIYQSDFTWDDDNNEHVHGFIIEWDYNVKLETKLLKFEVGDTGYINYEVRKLKLTSEGTYEYVAIKNAKVTFQSSNRSVAKVSSKGKVIAKGTGVCKITVKYKKVSKKVTVVVYPKKVSGLKKQSVTAGMVQLQWKKQSGVSRYQVWMYDPDVEEYVKMKTTKLTSATISGLDRNTKYRFKVRGYVKNGSKKYYGAYSKVLTVRTKK